MVAERRPPLFSFGAGRFSLRLGPAPGRPEAPSRSCDSRLSCSRAPPVIGQCWYRRSRSIRSARQDRLQLERADWQSLDDKPGRPVVWLDPRRSPVVTSFSLDTAMTLPQTYIATLVLTILSMLCWGSWAN